MSRPRQTLPIVLVVIIAGLAPPVSAEASQANYVLVLYVEPVAAAVVDPFRPPAHIGAPGNRGLEYGNDVGAVVSSAAEGFVSFAGQVGGTHAVTIEHWDGLRTTYTGLSELWVDENQTVAQRASLGLAARNLHFGARIRNHYLDPQVLLDASIPQPRPRLIPAPSQPN